MISPRRGEVWWGETLSHGRRPYVVLTRNQVIDQLVEIIVVPLTTAVRELPNEVELDESDGLPRPCVTSFDNLATIAKAQLTERITALGPAKMAKVCTALNATVDC